jgi:hypothetical protein
MINMGVQVEFLCTQIHLEGDESEFNRKFAWY